MSLLDRIGARRRPVPEPDPLTPGGGQALGSAALRTHRDDLARKLAELQFDLGGLTYEMAIRDHFRLDVLVERAAALQQVDAELASADHLLRLDGSGAAGACPSCGHLYARGSAFCARCGTGLSAHAVTAPHPQLPSA